jgi:hypothetical protein
MYFGAAATAGSNANANETSVLSCGADLNCRGGTLSLPNDETLTNAGIFLCVGLNVTGCRVEVDGAGFYTGIVSQ